MRFLRQFPALLAGAVLCLLAQAVPALLAEVLPEDARFAVWARFMSDGSATREEFKLTKDEIRAAVDGVDDYLESAKTGVDTAFPKPARDVLTPKQKARLVLDVARARWEVTQ